MPHTKSRFQQDSGFTDGILFFGTQDTNSIATGGTSTLTRNAAGDIAFVLANSTTATLSINLLGDGVLMRSGFFEDTQNLFGSTFGGGLGGGIAGPSGSPGTGIPASAEPQGRPDSYILPGQPQPLSAMGANQPITPRTGLKLKGVKPLALAVVYKVVTNPATTLTCRLDRTVLTAGAAIAPVNLLASAANGLTNVAAATIVTPTILIPNAVFYQVSDLTQLWFELSVVTPAGGTFQFYGVRMLAEFNYN